MRLATKNTLILISVYFFLLGGLTLWLETQLRTMGATLMEGTARLVGGEIAAAMSGSALEQVLQADPAARQRLEQLVTDLTARSDVVAAIAVVDESGKVIASDDLEIGHQLALPAVIFEDDQHAQFVSAGTPFRGATYHLFVPLQRGGSIVGYLRLSMASTRMAKLYTHAEHQLLLAAGAGLTFVVALGLVFHMQLVRRSAVLTSALERALRGESLPSTGGRDEFSQALEAARKVGEELSAARERTTDAQRRFGALMKAVDVGVVVLGSRCQLEFANIAARELFGSRDSGALEEHWDDIRARLDVALGSPPVRNSGRIDLDLPHPARPVRLRLELYPREEGEDGYLMLVRNRETIDALETELRLAMQMRGFARFYMAFAHDLKAPLNAMVLNLELLRDSAAKTADTVEASVRERQKRYIDVLQQEIARLDRYLRTLLTQAAPPDESRQQFDVRELIADLATLISPQAKQQDVTLETASPEHSVALIGHRDRLKQALLNIAINALESMPNGGSMGIELSSRNGQAIIAIHDSGPGISPELLPKIYGMHFTTKDGGTGIGLYVARSVVESHGGEIHVASQLGQGTCFTVDLPIETALPT